MTDNLCIVAIRSGKGEEIACCYSRKRLYICSLYWASTSIKDNTTLLLRNHASLYHILVRMCINLQKFLLPWKFGMRRYSIKKDSGNVLNAVLLAPFPCFMFALFQQKICAHLILMCARWWLNFVFWSPCAKSVHVMREEEVGLLLRLSTANIFRERMRANTIAPVLYYKIKTS